jgi:flagellar motor switch protein FliM
MATDEQPGLPQEVLSQSEVERVLADMNRTTEQAAAAVKPFRQSSILPESEFRRVRCRYERFVQALSGRLSTHLRTDVGVSMTKLETNTFQEFVAGIVTPSQLTLFKVEPQRGVCLFEIPPRLALTFVERLLGGPGHSVETRDRLSELELTLLDQVTRVLLTEWCQHWNDLQELRPLLLGHEIDARYLNTMPRSEVMFVLTMEFNIGDCREPVRLAFPYFTLEPLMLKLASKEPAVTEHPQAAAPAAPKWNQTLGNVAIPIVAEFDALDLSARQLASLKVGDMLWLDPSRLAQVRVRLARTPKFIGALGTCGPRWAVELLQKT